METENYEKNEEIMYTFTWVNSVHDIFITVIYANNEKEAIIKFFTEEFTVEDVVNYEIDLEKE